MDSKKEVYVLKKWFVKYLLNVSRNKIIVFIFTDNFEKFLLPLTEVLKHSVKDLELHLFSNNRIPENSFSLSQFSVFKTNQIDSIVSVENYMLKNNISSVDFFLFGNEINPIKVLISCNTYLNPYLINNILIEFKRDQTALSVKEIYILLEGLYFIGISVNNVLIPKRYHNHLEYHKQFYLLTLGPKTLMPLSLYFTKYNIKPRGVIHLGAHLGEEAETYSRNGIKSVLWIEANPEIYKQLIKNISSYHGHQSLNVLIADEDLPEIPFHLTNNTVASSIMDPGKCVEYYPQIKIQQTIRVNSKKLDSVLHDHNIKSEHYDFMTIDVQGAEYKALKGSEKLLKNINWIFIEVNLTNIYMNVPKLHTIDYFLGLKGFTRIATDILNEGWGNALYHKENITIITFWISIINALYCEGKYFLNYHLNKIITFLNRVDDKMKLILSN